jgi:hypothetical protein
MVETITTNNTANVTTEDIVTLLNWWVSSGALVSKRMMDLQYAEINRKFQNGTLFPTTFESIVARDKEIRDQFELLVSSKRVMSYVQLMVYHDVKSLYEANKRSSYGDFKRYDGFGRGCVVFVK